METKSKLSATLPMIIMGSLFVLINLLAFGVVGPFKAVDLKAFQSADDPLNLVFFFSVLIVFTAIVLIIAKYGKTRIIQAIFLGSTGLLGIYVFYPLLSYVLPGYWPLGVAVALNALIVALLFKYPEWYVVDISGIITAVGAIAMLGISLNMLFVLVLLIGMATYDAISVYKTKHMIDLADTLIDLKLPILFVIPKTLNYSLVKETKTLKEKLADGEKREAFFMGVGDVVIPGILTIAAFNIDSVHNFTIALSVVAGTLLGFAALMAFVIKGKPQAGLPFLCPGAILGYVISSLLLTGGLVGLTLSF
jgi:presenilin-like A22 family membrane protease